MLGGCCWVRLKATSAIDCLEKFSYPTMCCFGHSLVLFTEESHESQEMHVIDKTQTKRP
ncbi:hypothetical protein JMJ77_0004767 [Colletotrichum scovillei]|uniref:Uncharacterized protein n=1 Tax=Colletotrichum scovillei TaxID=1209932 RepID=A0A9P7RF68_9PEZI|nr:hypothetical protein JMJ77_0004767 [Colletotrichum scovillei]KAG7075974.1 hypothetical protein JMJ76_0013247 [Colletotrichum scovillei]KAG7083055.1 hypothetical protein JMJ78_0008506 [Colletotrichum scovillei]